MYHYSSASETNILNGNLHSAICKNNTSSLYQFNHNLLALAYTSKYSKGNIIYSVQVLSLPKYQEVLTGFCIISFYSISAN